jgi:UDP-N-acetylmuramyl pentapeptide phosphotransferase/UDP-N-acetylglucosamine-1-phosphate transferase
MHPTENKHAVFLGIVLCIAMAAFCFASAFFPKWDLRWGGRHGRIPHEDKPPLSPTGKFGFGILFGYAAVIVLLNEQNVSLTPWLIALYIPLFVGMGVIYRRDRHRHLEQKRRDV